MRKKVIAANWKMFKTPDETFAFMQAFLREVSGHNRDEIVLCPPYVDIATAVQAASKTVVRFISAPPSRRPGCNAVQRTNSRRRAEGGAVPRVRTPCARRARAL